ncbi:hypothetical protein H4R35_002105 [Dimargaris xerosporica]|nr:hypothetical protein H4R35_002105 [Dimargaris xerosporica]
MNSQVAQKPPVPSLLPSKIARRRTQVSFEPGSSPPDYTISRRPLSYSSSTTTRPPNAPPATMSYNHPSSLSTRRSVNLNAYGIPKQPSGTRRRNSVAITLRSNRPSLAGYTSTSSLTLTGELEERIRVCVRKRPLSARECNRQETDVIETTGRRTLVLHEPKTKVDLTKYVERHSFMFDEVFDESVNNHQLYRRTAMPLVEYIFQGGNATCFAYGQTGSGKTYTMLDPRQGLYVQAASDIFKLRDQPAYCHLTVLISFYEIYQSQLYDLLNNRKRLHAREDANQQVCINGLREVEIENVQDLMEVFEFGNTERSTGSTGANADSSRSHAILQIMLKDDHDNDRLHGKFSFIDLAGSERGADRGGTDAQTRREGSEINKSLLALKECIRALDLDKKHTPFRQSKLTQVLKDSLVGNSRTCMIATISPNISNCEHTLNTLRYTDRVKEIKGDRPCEGYDDDSACLTYDTEGQGVDDEWEENDYEEYYDCDQDLGTAEHEDDLVSDSLLNEQPSFTTLGMDPYSHLKSRARSTQHPYPSEPSPEPPAPAASSRRYNLRQRRDSAAALPDSARHDHALASSTRPSIPQKSSQRLRNVATTATDHGIPSAPSSQSSLSNGASMASRPSSLPRSTTSPGYARAPSSSHMTQPATSNHALPIPERSPEPASAPDDGLALDLADIDEFVTQHRLHIRETTEYCKQETKLVALYTLGPINGSASGIQTRHRAAQRATNGPGQSEEDEYLAKMHSAVSYLEQLDEVLEKKQNAVVELRSKIRQLVYQSQH